MIKSSIGMAMDFRKSLVGFAVFFIQPQRSNMHLATEV